MRAHLSILVRSATSWRALALAATMLLIDSPAPAADLQPPAGYFAAVRLGPGHSPPCAPAPQPFTGALDFPSKYAGSGKSRDTLNPESDEQYQRATRPIVDMEKGFSGLVTKFMASGDPARLQCAVDWLSAWAEARALEGDAADHTGRSMRKWSLASLSSAYLRLKFSSSAPLQAYPRQALRAEAWFGEVADLVKREWSPHDPIGKINNHYYWAAWAMMSAGVATNRRDLFDQSVALYHVFAAQVDADGYLPNELARGSRAAEYHSYALLPLAMIAAFGKANHVDLATEGDQALARLARRVVLALDEPASIAARAGADQLAPANTNNSAWAWLEPYCWTVTCDPPLRTRLSALRPLAVTRLGGNLSEVFSGAQAP